MDRTCPAFSFIPDLLAKDDITDAGEVAGV
jgi:hypothetical protein